MTQDILSLMDERRKWKLNTVKYRELDKEIKKKCRERREEWILQKCNEIEDLDKTNSPRVYDKIKELGSKKGISRNNIVKDKGGNILVEVDEVKNRWEEYANMLYNDKRGEILKFDGALSGSPIMQDEIRAAIKAMKKGQAAGENWIVIEMTEATEEFGIRKITDIANRIYESGYIPNAMRESVFVAIPKKLGALECSKHRTICIMSQLGKVLLRVAMNRIRGKINESVLEEQYGFRKGKGTTNAIFALRMIID